MCKVTPLQTVSDQYSISRIQTIQSKKKKNNSAKTSSQSTLLWPVKLFLNKQSFKEYDNVSNKNIFFVL